MARSRDVTVDVLTRCDAKKVKIFSKLSRLTCCVLALTSIPRMSLPAVTHKRVSQLTISFRVQQTRQKLFCFCFPSVCLESRWTSTTCNKTATVCTDGSKADDKALTDNFNQLGDKDTVLQVVSHVFNQRQFRPLPQLRIYPGRIRL